MIDSTTKLIQTRKKRVTEKITSVRFSTQSKTRSANSSKGSKASTSAHVLSLLNSTNVLLIDKGVKGLLTECVQNDLTVTDDLMQAVLSALRVVGPEFPAIIVVT